MFIGKHRVNSTFEFSAAAAAAAAKLFQLCPTLCDPIDGSPPGSPIPGILQARTLEWVAISFSSVGKWKMKVKSLSRVRLLATPWTSAYLAPPSMGFSRQEYWGGVPLPSLLPAPLSWIYLLLLCENRRYSKRSLWTFFLLSNLPVSRIFSVQMDKHMVFSG